MFLAIHWSNPKNTYFGPICFWLFIGAILRIHILVQYVLGLICFGSNMFWYEYVLGTICFGMNMFWSNMFPNMFWAQYVFVQYVLARHVWQRWMVWPDNVSWMTILPFSILVCSSHVDEEDLQHVNRILYSLNCGWNMELLIKDDYMAAHCAKKYKNSEITKYQSHKKRSSDPFF